MNKEREKYWTDPVGFKPLICGDCVYLIDDDILSCPAYPEGIPKEIGMEGHDTVKPNQVGDYIFTPKTSDDF